MSQILKDLEQYFLEDDSITPEQALNEQIGEFVGAYIVKTFLPTLDIFGFTKNHNTVFVDEDDRIEYNKIESEMMSLISDWDTYSHKHKEYVSFYKELERKYLPKVVKCYINAPFITDIESFLKGVEFGIWDSDISSYSINVLEEPTFEKNIGIMTINVYLHGKETETNIENDESIS